MAELAAMSTAGLLLFALVSVAQSILDDKQSVKKQSTYESIN